MRHGSEVKCGATVLNTAFLVAQTEVTRFFFTSPMLSIVPQSMRWRHHGANLSQVKLTSPPADGSHRGFTLIELLTVIAIIGILSAITFGIVKGVNERAAIGQARAELGALSQALESYKRQYGDYPWAGRSNASIASSSVTESDAQFLLFNALAGVLGPKCDVNNRIRGRSFIDVSKFGLLSKTENPVPGSGDLVENAFVDPWGRLYYYAYKDPNATPAAAAEWKATSYVLICAGPDGTILGEIPADGIITQAFRDDYSAGKGNLDNIYANQ